jgi:hypothetical protein
MPGSSFKVVLVQAVHENEGSFHELPMVSQTIQFNISCMLAGGEQNPRQNA